MRKLNEDERTGKIITLMNEMQRKHEGLEARLAKTSRELDVHSLFK
jgi:hypothetical protein